MKLDENLKLREIRLIEREKQQRLFSAWRNRQKDELELMATHKLLPEFLCIDDIATLSGDYTGALESIIRLSGVEFEEQEIQEGHGLLKGFTRQKYKEFLQSSGQWPPNGLLFNWWSLEESNKKPPIQEQRNQSFRDYLEKKGKPHLDGLTKKQIHEELQLMGRPWVTGFDVFEAWWQKQDIYKKT